MTVCSLALPLLCHSNGAHGLATKFELMLELLLVFVFVGVLTGWGGGCSGFQDECLFLPSQSSHRIISEEWIALSATLRMHYRIQELGEFTAQSSQMKRT